MAFELGDAVIMRHPKRDVTCCSCAVGQSLLATGSQDGAVYLWETSEGALLVRLSGGHTSAVTAVSFNPEATVLASCGADGHLIMWEVTNLDTDVRHTPAAGSRRRTNYVLFICKNCSAAGNGWQRLRRDAMGALGAPRVQSFAWPQQLGCQRRF